MLPYSRHYFKELIETGKSQKFALVTFGTRNGLILVPRLWEHLVLVHANTGFDLLQGNAQFRGEILGGCLESLYDILTTLYADSTDLCQNTNFSLTYPTGKEKSSC